MKESITVIGVECDEVGAIPPMSSYFYKGSVALHENITFAVGLALKSALRLQLPHYVLMVEVHTTEGEAKQPLLDESWASSTPYDEEGRS